MTRNKDTLYCNICNGLVILPSPAFMPCNEMFVANHVDSVAHLENLNKIPYQAEEGCGSVIDAWRKSIISE